MRYCLTFVGKKIIYSMMQRQGNFSGNCFMNRVLTITVIGVLALGLASVMAMEPKVAASGNASIPQDSGFSYQADQKLASVQGEII